MTGAVPQGRPLPGGGPTPWPWRRLGRGDSRRALPAIRSVPRLVHRWPPHGTARGPSRRWRGSPRWPAGTAVPRPAGHRRPGVAAPEPSGHQPPRRRWPAGRAVLHPAGHRPARAIEPEQGRHEGDRSWPPARTGPRRCGPAPPGCLLTPPYHLRLVGARHLQSGGPLVRTLQLCALALLVPVAGQPGHPGSEPGRPVGARGLRNSSASHRSQCGWRLFQHRCPPVTLVDRIAASVRVPGSVPSGGGTHAAITPKATVRELPRCSRPQTRSPARPTRASSASGTSDRPVRAMPSAPPCAPWTMGRRHRMAQRRVNDQSWYGEHQKRPPMGLVTDGMAG